MIKIYGIAVSRTARPMWALEELGLPYQVETVDFRKGDHKKPEFLKLNPMGRIPALQDGDVFLTESLAITLYIAQRYGTGKLWPADEPSRARVLQWSMWAATELEPVAYAMLKELNKKPEDRDAKVLNASRANMRPLLDYLDISLAGHPHLLGEAFTLADLQVAVVLDYANPRSKFDLSPWPRVAAWHEACHNRHAYQRLNELRAAVAAI